MDKEQFILGLCQSQFGTNLAGIIIFGSYNEGPYREGESDVDVFVLLHKFDKLDLAKEKSILTNSGEQIRLSVQQLTTLEELKDRIYREGSWSSWITLICGSKHIYKTEEFEDFVKEIKEKNIPAENLINYVKHKDELELRGYLGKTIGWDLTKGIYSHIRRKLQILNYYTTKKLEFSYVSCLTNTKFTEEERKILTWLSEMYSARESLTPEAAKMYFDISKDLTSQIEIILAY